MLVDQLHVYRTQRGPTKAEPILLIDPGTELPAAITLERLKTVSWRGTQKLKAFSRIELHQFARGDLDEPREPLGLSSLKQRLRSGTAKASNHSARV